MVNTGERYKREAVGQVWIYEINMFLRSGGKGLGVHFNLYLLSHKSLYYFLIRRLVMK